MGKEIAVCGNPVRGVNREGAKNSGGKKQAQYLPLDSR